MADMTASRWPSLQAYVLSGWAARTSPHLQLCLGFCPSRRDTWPVTTDSGQWPGRSRPVIALALTLPAAPALHQQGTAESRGFGFVFW